MKEVLNYRKAPFWITLSVLVLGIAAAILLLTVPAKAKGSGILTLEEVKKSESLYGQDKESVFQEYQLTDEDIGAKDGLDVYYSLKETREVGGLPFLYGLAFNLPSEYCGADLRFLGEFGDTDDGEILKALQTIYDDMIKVYGQPDNDPDVGRTHLADWIDKDPKEVSQSYDTWLLGEKTLLTLSIDHIEDREIITFSYRQIFDQE